MPTGINSLITVLIEQEKKTKDAVIKELKELGQIVPEVRFWLFCLFLSLYFGALPLQDQTLRCLTSGTLDCDYGRLS